MLNIHLEAAIIRMTELVETNSILAPRLTPVSLETLQLGNWCISMSFQVDCHGKISSSSYRACHIHSSTCLAVFAHQMSIEEFVKWVFEADKEEIKNVK